MGANHHPCVTRVNPGAERDPCLCGTVCQAAKEAAAAVTGAASAAQSYEERKYEGLHDGESSGHTDAAAPTTADVEVGAYDEELPALPSDDRCSLTSRHLHCGLVQDS